MLLHPRPLFSRLPSRDSRRGFVLLLSTVVLLALIMLIISFQQTITLDSIVSQNLREGVVTSWAARGGLELGQIHLMLDDEREFDSLNEPWAQEIEDHELGECTVSVNVVDEERKFNILACVRGEEEEDNTWARETLARLIQLARAEEDLELGSEELDAEDIVENIVEWLEDTSASGDPDTLLTEGGDYGYDSENLGADEESVEKSSPYEILTIAELMQIEGVTRDLLYGPPEESFAAEDLSTEDDEYDDYDDDEEDEEDEPQRTPLLDYITCYTTYVYRVNINTAPAEVLMALSPDMTQEIVDAIIDARETSDEEAEEAETSGETTEEEEEDTASFRPPDILSREAFNNKINEDDGGEEGESAEPVEVSEELWADIADRLMVHSEYFTIEARARTQEEESEQRGRIEERWRGLYLREREGQKFTMRLLILDREAGR